jgi:hypothetical protein
MGGKSMSYAVGCGCGCDHGDGHAYDYGYGMPVGVGGLLPSVGTILVLYVLLVIILRTFI